MEFLWGILSFPGFYNSGTIQGKPALFISEGVGSTQPDIPQTGFGRNPYMPMAAGHNQAETGNWAQTGTRIAETQ